MPAFMVPLIASGIGMAMASRTRSKANSLGARLLNRPSPYEMAFGREFETRLRTPAGETMEFLAGMKQAQAASARGVSNVEARIASAPRASRGTPESRDAVQKAVRAGTQFEAEAAAEMIKALEAQRMQGILGFLRGASDSQARKENNMVQLFLGGEQAANQQQRSIANQGAVIGDMGLREYGAGVFGTGGGTGRGIGGGGLGRLGGSGMAGAGFLDLLEMMQMQRGG